MSVCFIDFVISFFSQKEQQEQVLNQKVTALLQMRINVADNLKDTISMINSLQSKVLDEELIR